MKDELRHAFLDRARNDASVRVVVLTGAGDRAFCAGADIKERVNVNLSLPEFHLRQRATHELFRAIESFEKPVIAAINGVWRSAVAWNWHCAQTCGCARRTPSWACQRPRSVRCPLPVARSACPASSAWPGLSS